MIAQSSIINGCGGCCRWYGLSIFRLKLIFNTTNRIKTSTKITIYLLEHRSLSFIKSIYETILFAFNVKIWWTKFISSLFLIDKFNLRKKKHLNTSQYEWWMHKKSKFPKKKTLRSIKWQKIVQQPYRFLSSQRLICSHTNQLNSTSTNMPRSNEPI